MRKCISHRARKDHEEIDVMVKGVKTKLGGCEM